MINLDDALIYVLGYLTAEQWVDALECTDEETVYKLLNAIDDRYSGMKDAVDNLIKANIVKRLSK